MIIIKVCSLLLFILLACGIHKQGHTLERVAYGVQTKLTFILRLRIVLVIGTFLRTLF